MDRFGRAVTHCWAGNCHGRRGHTRGQPDPDRASLGHVVEEADPNLDMVALRPMNARISAANTARSCHMRWKALGREPNTEDVEVATWAVYQRGLKVSGIEYIEAIAAAHQRGAKWRHSLPCWRWPQSSKLLNRGL
ncbi:MAG: hypothetical protein JO358_02695, partial [Alphaproteobacteria bacterium]|nr:hypothetical protein [Alphaproteobacteria bacterium]